MPAEPTGQAEEKVDGRAALSMIAYFTLTTLPSPFSLPDSTLFLFRSPSPQIRRVPQGTLAHPPSREAGRDSSQPTVMVFLPLTDWHEGLSV